MYGQNEISKPRLLVDGFSVTDIFYTIQGEGPWSGYPSVFVRFAGCNLRCLFCDTDFSENKRYEPSELLVAIRGICGLNNCSRIVLTGGEPMLQGIGWLISRLPNMYWQVETAGTVWPNSLMPIDLYHGNGVVLVCSPKTPKIDILVREHCADYKYIIEADNLDPDDGLPKGVFRPRTFSNIWVQPCDVQDPVKHDENIRATVRSALAYGYRVSMQTHKYLGVP